MNKKQKRMLYRILISIVLLIGVTVGTHLVEIPEKYERLILFICYLIPYLVIGYDILKKAGKGIINRQVFDENFLMAVATIGAFALGEYLEAVAVMLFYQIGELFQSYAVGKSRKNISALMDIRPDYANVENDGQVEQVDPDEVEIGTVILIRPGEKIPLDGIVVEGNSSINTVALTGESVPRMVEEGQEVLSGCINLSGVLRVKTTKEFEESTVSKILDLVENASSRKAKSEQFISKFARIYTPVVCYLALALAVLPPLILLFMGQEPQVGTWIYRALTFLVISCPCALVISIPLSFFAGIGGAGHAGILIKGSNYLETFAKTKYIVFDKTGTLTEGVFEVTKICPERLSENQLLEYAAYAENHSSHPISKSLRQAYGKEIDGSRLSNVEEISGNGVVALVDGQEIAVGNRKLMEKKNIPFVTVEVPGTLVYVAVNGTYEGYIVISDVIKSEAKQAIAKLKKAGIVQTIMLTGDIKNVADSVAKELGIDEVHSELLPEDKVHILEEKLESGSGTLAFVGDGLNDAPVLSRADIGIAMGAMGSDAAIEAADVVLMDDNPMKISLAIGIAKKCIRIVYENIYFAIGVKVLCLILGALGIANMWVAIFADVGVMVIAVLNAIRALMIPKQ